MQIVPVTQSADMSAWIVRWNQLAGDTPFLRWEWLGTWWEHYAPTGDWRLMVLVVQDAAGQAVGFAPWYFDPASRSVRFLGSGKVCTDYLTLLCEPTERVAVAESIAQWLLAASATQELCPAWNQIELIGALADDPALTALRDACARLGMGIHETPGQEIYCLALPGRWEEYLQKLSGNGRRQARQGLSALNDGMLHRLHVLKTPDAIEDFWPTLVDLHQRRRHSVGDTGCFDSAPFSTFLLDASRQLADKGLLEIHVLEYDSRPLAFQYITLGRRTLYTYQSGIDPDYTAQSPGRVLIAGCIAQAIERGYGEFDFMRGGEEYKKRWRAESRATMELRIVAPRVAARLRHRFWLTSHTVKRWIKSTTGRAS